MKECWHGGAGFAFKNGWAGAAGSSLGAGSEGVKRTKFNNKQRLTCSNHSGTTKRTDAQPYLTTGQ